MKRVSRSSKLALGLTAAMMCTGITAESHAAGFAIKEQSVSGQGTSFAGASANTDDNSAMFFNAASLAFQKGN